MSPDTLSNSLVSVIMPVKHFDSNIYPAIRSILEQTYKNIELIIIGSDLSKSENDVIFKDKRIILLECDGNISKALNMGLAAAKGEFIMRMDSDDFCDPRKLQVQLDALVIERVDVVGCNMNFVDKHNKLILKKIFPEKDKEIKFFMPVNVTLSHSAMLTYKSVYEKVGLYNESMSKVEDLELFLRMIDKDIKFYNVQEHLYSYKIKNEIWDIDNINNKISYIISRDYINNQLLNNHVNQNDNILRKALLEYYKGNMTEARKSFILYLKLKPSKVISLLRYLLVSIFIGKHMRILRKYNIPQNYNLFYQKYLKKDLQYKSKL